MPLLRSSATLDERHRHVERLPDETLAEIYRHAATIAVVGASTNPEKPAHGIPAYLQSQGFRIIPVNPVADEILGEPTVGSLADIAEPVDVVNVFRPSAEAPGIAEQAAALGASTLWLQVGIESEEAAEIATGRGLTVVMDACMGAMHLRLTKTGCSRAHQVPAAWPATREAPRTERPRRFRQVLSGV